MSRNQITQKLSQVLRFWLILALAAGSVLSTGTATAAPARLALAASALDGFAPSANETVHAVAVQPDGKIIVAGKFITLNGETRNKIGRLNPDGSLDPAFDPGVGPNEYINRLLLQPDGKIIVTGYFTSWNGEPRYGIARLTASGSLDTGFSYPSDGIILSLVQQPDGKILVAGSFMTMGGSYCVAICRLDSNGAYDPTFNPAMPDNLVYKVLVQPDGKIVIGGVFTTLNGMPHAYVGRLNADGSLDSSFSAQANNMVNALALQPDGKILVGGLLTTLNGQSRSNIGRLNPDGSLDSFNPGADGIVFNIYLQLDGKIFVTGGFNTLGGTSFKFMGRLNQDGTPDASFNPGTANFAEAVAFQPDGKIVIVGGFLHCIARLYPDGSLDATLDLFLSGSIDTMTLQPDQKIVVGGMFTNLGTDLFTSLARLSAGGIPEAAFAPTLAGFDNINAVVVQPDGKMVVAGNISTINGVPRSNIARLNADGTLDAGFDTGAVGANGTIISLALQPDGKILVAGGFTSLGGQARSCIGRLNQDGTLDETFNAGTVAGGIDGPIVLALALQPDGKIVVGGNFTTLSGGARSFIGRLNADGSLDAGFDPGANEFVTSLALQADGKILVAGVFTTLGGSTRLGIGRLDAAGSLDTFNPGTDGFVHTLAVQTDGKIVVGGSFGTLGGEAHSSLGRLNPDGTVDSAFTAGVDNYVNVLALQPDGKTLVSGDFTTLGGEARYGFGRLSSDIAVAQDLSVDLLGTTVTWMRSGPGPEVWRVTFEQSSDGVTYTSLGNGTRITGGWQLTGLSLARQQNRWIRARGFYKTGAANGSEAIIESVLNIYLPKVIFKAKPAATGSGTCLTWADACTLQTALGKSIAGDEIWVAAGTHTPGASGARNSTFQLKSGVAIYGGFFGDEDLLGERDWTANLTILSGDLDSSGGLDTNDAYHVVTGSGVEDTAVLDGFTISGGYANVNPQWNGGGMYNLYGNPTLANLVFSGNYSYAYGAGMYNDHSSPRLENILFDNNYSVTHGGGLFNTYSSPWLSKVTFQNNQTRDRNGGGMYNVSNSTPVLVNVTFTNNHADDFGGGMYNNFSNPRLANVIFLNNTAATGGAINNVSANPVLSNVTIYNNSASTYGGGINNNSGSNPSLANTILWANTAITGTQIYNASGTPVIAYSDIQDAFDASNVWDNALGTNLGGNLDIDPLFTSATNLRLQATSPVIDAGDNSRVLTDTLDLDGNGVILEPVPYDLDGNTRFFDHPRLDSGAGIPPIVDMGAYEALSFSSLVAAGGMHTCATTNSGGAQCWGDNGDGQLGNNSTTGSLIPVDVSGLGSGVIRITAGEHHSCAVTSSGAARCWGLNYQGQLGDGTFMNWRLEPVQVSGLTGGVTEIDAGGNFTCALVNGGVKCWGGGGNGQLGNGASNDSPTPVTVNGLGSGVSAIAVGGIHACALTGGVVWCWGANEAGQLGNGSTGESNTPVSVVGLPAGIIAIAAGGEHTCALTSSGSVKCWGQNMYGQLGDNSTTFSSTPVDVSGLSSGIAAITAGGDHTCALTSSGGVRCWGRNDRGQLGDGTITNRLTPADVSGLTSGAVLVSAGDHHTCARFSSQAIKCWGNNDNGELGNGASSYRSTPQDVSGAGSNVTAIDAGDQFTCAVIGGAAKCWGSNIEGQLGDGTTTDRSTPISVSSLGSGITSVAAGEGHACALTSDGGVKCWGNNEYGQSGDNTTDQRLTPVQVLGLTSGVSAIAAGDSHTCALVNGGVKCWGRNMYGQLGDNSQDNRLQPVDVYGLGAGSGVTAITAGEAHTCALLTGGAVKCWGANWYGQLGNNSYDRSSQPVDVSGLGAGSETTAISAGNGHTCAVVSGGVKCWGNNGDGQLGDNSDTNRLTPVDVSGLSGVTIDAVSAGGNHTCARTSAGALKCWGNNETGQLGDGSTTESWTPMDVSGLTSGIAMVTAGGSHTCALTTSGAAKCWGNTSNGQLGIGVFGYATTPVYVIGYSNSKTYLPLITRP